MIKEPLFKTLNELYAYVLTYLPEAEIGEDNDGQLVIYTNLYEDDHQELATFSDDE